MFILVFRWDSLCSGLLKEIVSDYCSLTLCGLHRSPFNKKWIQCFRRRWITWKLRLLLLFHIRDATTVIRPQIWGQIHCNFYKQCQIFVTYSIFFEVLEIKKVYFIIQIIVKSKNEIEFRKYWERRRERYKIFSGSKVMDKWGDNN